MLSVPRPVRSNDNTSDDSPPTEAGLSATVSPADTDTIPSSAPPGYRPEIDGLRAVAIALVLLYHVRLSCPAGFIGVDVFLVLSGFLITSLIWQSLERNDFSLAGFWERRIRRLYPALTVMVLATLVAGPLLFYPQELKNMSYSAVAQALLCANLFFWHVSGNYFIPSGDYPLLHTWSLALEEQFYLFFPFFIAFIFRRERLRRPVAAGAIMLGLFAASLLLAVFSLPSHQSAVFYLPPARAWEFICGAVLAITPFACFSPGKRLRETASWLGMGGILLPAWLYSSSTPFPGLAALPPCIGTLLILWANIRPKGATTPPTSLGRLLTWRPAVFLGLISYSLYLWHWPVIVFYRLWSLSPEGLTLPAKLGVIIASLILAIGSWHLIEQPFRKRRFLARRRDVFVFFGCSIAVVLVSAGWLAGPGGRLLLSSKIIQLNTVAKNDIGPVIRNPDKKLIPGKFMTFGVDGPPVALVWGDSHAMCALPAMDALFRQYGQSGRMISAAAAPPLTGGTALVEPQEKDRLHAWAEAVFAQIAAQRIPNVVLAARWSLYEKIDPALLESALIATIRRFDAMGCRVWILMDVPTAKVPVPRALRRLALTGENNDSWCPTKQEHQAENSALYRLAKMELPATFMDPSPLLFDPVTNHYRFDSDGVSLYVDTNHLTSNGARLILLPFLRTNLAEILAPAKTAQ